MANLSAITVVFVPRKFTGSFDNAIQYVSKKTNREKKNFAGLPHMLGIIGYSLLLPHSIARKVAGALAIYASSLLNRGMVVTNIGKVDAYLEPFGAIVKSASVMGPFLRGICVPVVTATGFRDTLTLQINDLSGHTAEDLDDMVATLEVLLERERITISN